MTERFGYGVVPAHSGAADRLDHAEVGDAFPMITRHVLVAEVTVEMIPAVAPARAVAAMSSASVTSPVRMCPRIE
jgi:hypothetical protein